MFGLVLRNHIIDISKQVGKKPGLICGPLKAIDKEEKKKETELSLTAKIEYFVRSTQCPCFYNNMESF